MFLNHFKNFYPGGGRDRLIEVAAHFRIVANLGYLLVNSSVKRNQESLLRSRQIAEARFEVGGPGNVLCPECAIESRCRRQRDRGLVRPDARRRRWRQIRALQANEERSRQRRVGTARRLLGVPVVVSVV